MNFSLLGLNYFGTSDSPALDIEKVEETICRLERRIGMRFPDRQILKICGRLREQAEQARDDEKRLVEGAWKPTCLAAVVVMLTVGALAFLLHMFISEKALGSVGFLTLLQTVETSVNIAIFLYLGSYFGVTLKRRWKRSIVLPSLNQIRSLIHVIDMHQLTKDPEIFFSPEQMAEGRFPVEKMTRFEMVRYLDYCSEMYSLASKVAARYSTHCNDDVVLRTVNDIESIATGFSHKVWQKIDILGAGRRIEVE